VLSNPFNVRFRSGRVVVLVALAALIIASLACGPLGGGEEEAAEEEAEEAEVEEEAAAEVVEEPTEAPPTATPKPKEPPPTPEPEAGITVDNAGDLATLRTINIAETPLLTTAFAPESHLFATSGYDKLVRIFDADSGDLVREMPGSGEYGFGLAYSPDGSLLASSGGYHVYFWDPQSGKMVNDVIVNSFVFRVVWSPDGTRLAVVGQGSSKIEFVDPKSGTLLADETLRNPTGYVLWALAYTPDGTMLATADGDGRVSVLEADTGVIVFEDTLASRGAAYDMEFSPDGTMLASCNKGGGVYIWETSNWEVVLSGDDLFSGGCLDGAFSPGSDIYYGAGNDGWLMGWDTSEGNLLTSLSFPKAIWMISTSTDGELLSVALDNGSAYVVGLR
jgi:WD40 repeat protein